MNSADWLVITIGLWAVAAALIVMALASNHHHDNNGYNAPRWSPSSDLQKPFPVTPTIPPHDRNLAELLKNRYLARPISSHAGLGSSATSTALRRRALHSGCV